ncbi:MAG: peptide deformylase [Verrucomicrobia bacterium]|nr:peptide deformylase [Verrucomicrobiota bacterium]
MSLEIVKYGTPVLRKKGAPIEKITPEIEHLVTEMFATMYAAHGVGLAAQQIGKALQLCVIDVSEVDDRPSTLELNGEPSDVNAYMPLTLINPKIKPYGKEVSGPEGCLSFPEIYGDITRQEHVEVTALNVKGQEFSFRCGGLLARAVQHEVDHLNGILFIDRMQREDKGKLREELEDLQAITKAELK